MALQFTAPAWAQPAQIADLFRLSIPVAFSRMAIPVMSVTDVVVLGRMAQLEVPYITNGYIAVSVGLAIGLGLLQGIQVFTAELSGVGQQHNTGRVFRRGLWIGLALGVAFTLLNFVIARPIFETFGHHFGDKGFTPEVVEGAISVSIILGLGLVWHMVSAACSFYLEALRRPGIVTFVMYLGVVVNLVFDLALVAGWWGFPELGADGVAWATTGTRVFLSIALLICVILLTPGFRKSDRAPADEFRRQTSVGGGTAVANAAEYLGFNLTFTIATIIGIAAGTIYSLAIQPIFLSFMLFVGIGTATSVRVAEFYARRDWEGVKNASRLGVVSLIISGVVIGLFMYLFRTPMAEAMVMRDTGVGLNLAPVLSVAIGIAAIALIFDGLQAVASMALRAQDVVWLPTVIHTGSYFVIMLPAAWIFGVTMNGGAVGVMWGAVAGSVVAGVAQTVLLEIKNGAGRNPAP